jgi:DNA-binding CsgD family transcriptional regulator
VGTVAPVPGIRGRAAEIAVLSESLDRVASGRPAIVLIEGEAGIGKTRLLAEALREARGRGMQVVAGRAEELEQTRPFGLVAGAFGCDRSSPDPRRAAIAGLLATEGGGDRGPITVTSDPGLRFHAVDAFAGLAEQLALSGPLVIGVDDLQWADPSSLLTLGALARRLAYLPMALIGCFRPSPRAAELDQLVRALEAVGTRHLTLRRLSEQAVAELVAETLDAVPGPGLLAGISGAAGNPLFVTELLAALAQEGAIETAGGRAEAAELILPPTLRLTILRRLSFLPDGTLQALRAASILGSSFTVTELSVTMARPVLELSRTLADGIAGQVLEDDGDRLWFRHDLIRDAIYEDLPGSVRRGLHREAGQRLAASGAAALRVAEHLARGASQGDAEAIGWLARAAREAAPTSPDVAADLLDRATGLMHPADPGRDHLLAERASSLMWAGRAAPAEDLCRALLDRHHDPSVDASARICLGHALLVGGRPRDGLRELERAGRSAALTSAEQASALGWASIARKWLGDLDGSAAVAEQARSAAPVAGDHLTTAIAMASLAGVSELRGRLRDALQTIDDAVRLADQSPGRRGHRYPLHGARSFILIELDRFEEARSALDTERRISEQLGLGWHLPSYQMVRIAERFAAGEWDDATAEIEASIELADETRQAFGLVLGRSVLSLISLHRNELSRAEESAAVATRQLAETGIRYRAHWALWARALLLEADGRNADALATLAGCWDWCARHGLKLEFRMLGADLVRLALAGGERARAREVAAAVAELAAENPEVSSLAGAALRCRGLAEDDAEILHAAVAAYASAPRPLERALACEDAGAALVRQGDTDRAHRLLDQAVAIYERLDAARDLARAEAVLRRAGIRRGRRGPRGRPQTGWHSLTPTERTVAQLVAEGLSNPQIGDRLYVSRRTVQTHLAHVFAKLDLTSRAQLATVVTQHQGDQP